MVVSFPCEEPEYLLELLRKRKFQGTKLRTNVARGQPTEKHPSGRVMLKDAVLSDVVKSGRLVNAVRKYHPWVEQLTLNKNLCCSRHTDRNEGNSLIAFFGDFQGGVGSKIILHPRLCLGSTSEIIKNMHVLGGVRAFSDGSRVGAVRFP